MSETWKKESGWSDRDDDGLPKFGKKARVWFERSLRDKLSSDESEWIDYFGIEIPDAELDAVVGWFAASPMKYIKWRPAKEYCGRGFAHGGWVVAWATVRSELREALAQIRAASRAARFSTLEDWLRADIAGDVDSGAEGGSQRLPKKLRRELQQNARARRKGLARICRSCRREFQPTCNRAQRCESCINGGELAGRHKPRSSGSPS